MLTITLSGPPGCGKSWMAALIKQALAEGNQAVREKFKSVVHIHAEELAGIVPKCSVLILEKQEGKTDVSIEIIAPGGGSGGRSSASVGRAGGGGAEQQGKKR